MTPTPCDCLGCHVHRVIMELEDCHRDVTSILASAEPEAAAALRVMQTKITETLHVGNVIMQLVRNR